MNFDEELRRKTEETERLLAGFLPEAQGYQRQVIEAMNYSVTAGGKRLRPMLMAESAALFADPGSAAMLPAFMAAIEMIHTYSLVHDDLPAMDNDEYRRGRKTTHGGAGRGRPSQSGV